MATSVPKVPLGSQGLYVSAQGLGCMSMSAFYGDPKPEQEMVELIRFAVNSGITLLDTADIYGPFTNEILVGKAIKGIRDKVQLCTKFAIEYLGDSKRRIRGDAEYVRSACEASLKRLEVDYIDLYYQHRVDPTVPIEITVGEMKKLHEEGKIKYIGLSEASAKDIRRAHAVHPITAVQLEYSLWSRDVEEEIIPTCRELGIGIVAYSPIGRGFFSGKAIVEEIGKEDFRTNFVSRFQGENLERNKVFYERLCEIAAKKKCTAGQLALAWIQKKGIGIVPIPGTTKLKNLQENMAAVSLHLSEEEMKKLETAVPIEEVAGDRYLSMVGTWKFTQSPPLPVE